MLSPVLARTLAAGRPWFNERVGEARQRLPGFDVDSLRGFIATELDGLAVAVETVEPDRVGEAAQVAYEIGIELVGQRLLGHDARLPWVRRSWEVLVPAIPRLVARAPRDTLGAVINAAVQLGSTPGVRMEQWIERLAAAGPSCTDVVSLRLAGAVCAWRAGMVQLRGAALDAAAQLPPEVTARCLDLGACADMDATLHRLRADRWSGGLTEQEAGWTLGGFTGFGGPFAEPPEVRVDAAGFIARASGRPYVIEADAFGAAILPGTVERFDAARPLSEALPHATRAALAARLAAPEEDLVVVTHGPSLLVTSPWTHRVFVGPRGP